MFWKSVCVIIVVLLAGLGCQTKPTKVYDSIEAKLRKGEKVEVSQISPATVIVDARPSFEYSISHINGSVNIRWDEFTQPVEAFRGLFESDLYFHARRLARMGIGPDTPVIVVGRGPQGGGEEGRVAWTLKYLGVKNVEFMHIDAFDRPRPNQEAPPHLPVPIWKPILEESLIIGKKDFLRKAIILKTEPDAPIIIDVRPGQEYLGKMPQPFPTAVPDLGAVNIPWTEFLSSQGISRTEVKDQLAAIGVTPEKEIIVISNRGVESAAVAMVLRSFGYSKTANMAGGYSELLAEPESASPNKRSKK
jgi:thiosulfate/3-mercaptopyruvate sulfurtransferase